MGLTASHNRYQSFGLKELFCTVLPKQQGTHQQPGSENSTLQPWQRRARGCPSRPGSVLKHQPLILQQRRCSHVSWLGVGGCVRVHFASVLNLRSDREMRQRLSAAGHPLIGHSRITNRLCKCSSSNRKMLRKHCPDAPPHKVQLNCVELSHKRPLT